MSVQDGARKENWKALELDWVDNNMGGGKGDGEYFRIPSLIPY